MDGRRGMDGLLFGACGERLPAWFLPLLPHHHLPATATIHHHYATTTCHYADYGRVTTYQWLANAWFDWNM